MTARDHSDRRTKKHRPQIGLDEPIQDDPVVRRFGNWIQAQILLNQHPMGVDELAAESEYDDAEAKRLIEILEREGLITIMESETTGQPFVVKTRFGPGKDRLPPL